MISAVCCLLVGLMVLLLSLTHGSRWGFDVGFLIGGRVLVWVAGSRLALGCEFVVYGLFV